MYCSNCGKLIEEGEFFCMECGSKTSLSKNKKTNFSCQCHLDKSWLKSNAVIIVIIVILLSLILCASFINKDAMCSIGAYNLAYKIAKTSQKDDVLFENLVAVESAHCVCSLNDDTSFVLKDAYLTDKNLVLVVSAKNKLNARVKSYWLYCYDEKNTRWSFDTYVIDLDVEENYEYEDIDTQIEKLAKNIKRVCIIEVMNNGKKLDDESIERINKLFEKNKLDKVGLIDVEWEK